MFLGEFIQPGLVWSDLKANNKLDLISELSEKISKSQPLISKENVARALTKREELGSTGIEDGVAIPHAKITGLDRTIVAFARKIEGIDFQAHDGKPSHLFFVLLAPEGSTTLHLKVLARLSRLLKRADFRNQLLKAANSSAIYEAIIREDKSQ
ncbi:MAG: PTS sugar transporter subunit IIA [Pseudomonadota bacterium]